MTKEELMEEVKRRYPIGCRIKDHYGDSNIVKDYKESKDSWDYKSPYLFYGSNECIEVYSPQKEWAEIISLPEGIASIESSPLQFLFQKLMN